MNELTHAVGAEIKTYQCISVVYGAIAKRGRGDKFVSNVLRVPFFDVALWQRVYGSTANHHACHSGCSFPVFCPIHRCGTAAERLYSCHLSTGRLYFFEKWERALRGHVASVQAQMERRWYFFTSAPFQKCEEVVDVRVDAAVTEESIEMECLAVCRQMVLYLSKNGV